MGKKGGWFNAVKKAFSPESKKSKKSKQKWDAGKSAGSDPTTTLPENVALAPPPVPTEEMKLTEAENEQNKHVYSVAIATAVAAEAAVAAAQAAAEVVRLTTVTQYSGKSREEVAAVKIQTAFRGYLARRALRALRGLVRLKSLIDGNAVKRQATTTLRCMQTLAKVQSQIRSRRIKMSEENQALQRQLLQKSEKELENLRASMADDWDDSIQSKEQVEANLLSKHEAAIRRERALAYAYSHQTCKNSSRSVNPMYMDPNNPHWGWSWLERWMAARPWESQTATEKQLNDTNSMKSASYSIGGEITRAYAQRDLNIERPSPVSQKPSRPGSRQSPSTPKSKASSVVGKSKMASPRGGWGLEDDSRSMMSLQSERPRRHSIAGSSVRDDESLASSPAVPSYMVPTESARAKARLQSPLGEKHETPERVSAGSAKKRLSFQASPAGPRRHSGPPRVDITSIKEIDVNAGHNTVINGGSK